MTGTEILGAALKGEALLLTLSTEVDVPTEYSSVHFPRLDYSRSQTILQCSFSQLLRGAEDSSSLHWK